MKKKPYLHDINPKAVTNDELFGFINPSTREWRDGNDHKSASYFIVNIFNTFFYVSLCISLLFGSVISMSICAAFTPISSAS